VLVLAGAGFVVLRQADDSSSPVAGSRCAAGSVDSLDLSDPAQGVLVWSDDFDGSTVDRSRWRVRDADRLSFDQARIRGDAVTVADGRLRITVRDAPGLDRSDDRPVTTGYLDTIGRFSQQYGRWEVRARLPTAPGESRGIWPAFWLRADDLPGEIDVMEAWGTPTSRARADMDRQYAWTVHEDTQAPAEYRRVGGWGESSRPLSDGFHTYAVDWVPGCLRFSLDGRTTGVVDLAREPRLRAALDDTVNIRLNVQVGSRYWGRLDPARPGTTRLPATLEVDRVRVFRPR
jgi:beta-glucanase (GH16 family)